jgi:hypothetical protein
LALLVAASAVAVAGAAAGVGAAASLLLAVLGAVVLDATAADADGVAAAASEADAAALPVFSVEVVVVLAAGLVGSGLLAVAASGVAVATGVMSVGAVAGCFAGSLELDELVAAPLSATLMVVSVLAGLLANGAVLPTVTDLTLGTSLVGLAAFLAETGFCLVVPGALRCSGLVVVSPPVISEKGTKPGATAGAGWAGKALLPGMKLALGLLVG